LNLISPKANKKAAQGRSLGGEVEKAVELAAHKIAGAILDGECRPEGLGAGTAPSKSPGAICAS